MNVDPSVLIAVGVCQIVFSLWASGFNAFTRPRWSVPRIMLSSRFTALIDRVFARLLGGKTFLEIHRERNSMTHRMNQWLLSLSDTSDLTEPQKIERFGWLQFVFGGGLLFAIGIAGLLL